MIIPNLGLLLVFLVMGVVMAIDIWLRRTTDLIPPEVVWILLGCIGIICLISIQVHTLYIIGWEKGFETYPYSNR